MRMDKWKRAWLVILAAVFLCLWGPMTVPGLAAAFEGAAVEPEGMSLPGQEKWEDIDQFLRKVQPETGSTSFSRLVQSLMAGKGKQAGRILLDLFQKLLLQEVRNGGRLAGQLIALCIMGAVFSNFSGIFHSGQVSETGFFLTYLLVAAVLAAAVLEGVEITRTALESQTAFMRVLLPAYLLAITWAGGSMTAAAWMELILLLLSLVPWLYLSLLLPLIRIYTLLVMAGNMGKEDMLSKMAELVQSLVRWGSRTLFGVVIGFQAIQGMVLPYADAVKTSGAQKLLQVIPGVGQGLGAAAKLLIGSGVLIKNSMGAAAIVVLLVLSLTPILKLSVLFLLYRATASLLQPISDKRLVACIAGVAEGEKLLLGLTVSGMMVFILTIALICMGTNVTYLA